MLKVICPDCGKIEMRDVPVTNKPQFVDKPGKNVLHIACVDCHKIRQAKIKEIDSRYQGAEELGLEGSKDIPYLWCHRPHSRGRRIFHKTDHLGG